MMVGLLGLFRGLGCAVVPVVCLAACGTSASNGSDAGSISSATDAAIVDFQQHNLDVINQYRASQGIAALALDPTLNSFAQAGTSELVSDHTPHHHFQDASAAGTLFQDGFKSTAAENQGDPNGWRVMSNDPAENERLQIDDIQQTMFAEGPGTDAAHGHYENIMNAKFRRLGVGLLMVENKLYLTNDFSD
jgi:uncharacterized protein YkwD